MQERPVDPRVVFNVSVRPHGYGKARVVALHTDNSVSFQAAHPTCSHCRICSQRVMDVESSLNEHGAIFTRSVMGVFTVSGFPNDGSPTPQKVCEWLREQVGVGFTLLSISS